MKTTDNNQKKQLTELSDEDLKQVTGGFNPEEEKCYPKTSFEGGACPSIFADKGDKCCYGGDSMQYAIMEEGIQAVQR